MEFKIQNLDELKKAGHHIKKNHIHKVICFYGEPGAGKTTLIKFLGKEFGVNSLITSPSFSILNEYDIREEKTKKIYHFDFYRIQERQEIYDLGYEDYFFSGQICFIEWPNRLEDLLPEKYHSLKIEITGLNTRKINFT